MGGRFTEALGRDFKEEQVRIPRLTHNQSLLSPFLLRYLKTKKGEKIFVAILSYDLFLSSNSAKTAPITASATNKPTIAGTKY